MSDPFLGEIKMFGGPYAPMNYAYCSGQLLPIRQYTALFSLLGVNYGGDGVQTFGLPNLQGATPIGTGNGPGLTPRVVGDSGGVESVTLTYATTPSHTHTAMSNAVGGNQAAPAGYVSAQAHQQRTTKNLYSADSGPTPVPPATPPTLNPSTLPPVGQGQAHTNLPPFLTVSFIIALSGVFPQRP